MVYRWQCRRCSFSVWAGGEEPLREAVERHLVDHHRGRLSKTDFLFEWDCPYCEKRSGGHDKPETLRSFRDHLFDHVEPMVEPSVHVADPINGVGDVLLKAPHDEPNVENARIHLLSPGDLVLITTVSPAKRLEMMDRHLSEWPAWTIVITTKDNPLGGLDLDLSGLPLEVVKLEKRMALDQLGETISRVLHENETSNAKVSFEFDVLPEILDKFELDDVFQFLTVLSARLDRSNALSHYYLDHRRQPDSTVNVLEEVFDLSIRVEEHHFVSE
jgi:hypothetical protein